MSERVKRFKEEREKLNEVILNRDNINIKRFFGLDNAVYRDGALDARTKEMLGLAASMVLRCNDCIDYHIIQCVDLGVTEAELTEVFNVALIVGGSIVIPHLRHAFDTMDALLNSDAGKASPA